MLSQGQLLRRRRWRLREYHHERIAQWNLAYRAAVNKRTFDNLCDAEIDVNQTGPTKWNMMVVVERTARRFEIRITRCMYHELTTSLGIPELTPPAQN